MKKLLLVFLVCATVLLAADSRPVFKIGIVVPMTGDCAHLGQDIQNGIAMALEDNPITAVKYECYYEDTQNLPRLDNQSALRLITLNKVDTIISMWTQSANIVGPIAEKSKTIHFSISWDPSSIGDKQWTLVYGPSLEDFARTEAEILDKAGCKRVALTGCVHTAVQKMLPMFRKLFAERNIDVVFDQQVAPSERDLRGYALKLREANPDGVLQLFEPPQDEIFNRQCRELGFAPKVTTGWFDAYTPQARFYINGFPYPSEIHPDKKFSERFAKRFVHEPFPDSPYAYDIVTMIIHEVEGFYSQNQRIPTHEELLKALKTPRELPNLMAGKGRMHKNGWLETPFVIRRMVDGKAIDWKP